MFASPGEMETPFSKSERFCHVKILQHSLLALRYIHRAVSAPLYIQQRMYIYQTSSTLDVGLCTILYLPIIKCY